MLQSQKSFEIHFHPLALAIYFIILAAVSMNYSNPLYLASILGITASGIFLSGNTKPWMKYLALCISMSALIVIINILASKNGSTTIFKSNFPLFGEIAVSLEALLFGLNMGLKLTLIISVFFLYASVMDPDRAFGFFSRYVPRSSLLVILSSLLLPNMKRDLVQIGETMQTRGADFQSPNLLRRIKAKYPMLKILLLSSLEGSWETAEALYARGFGIGKRTSHIKLRWSQSDNFLISGALVSFLAFVLSYIKGRGFTDFYPSVGKFINSQDPILLSTLSAGLLSLPLTVGLLRWKSSKSKI